ncbi:DNA repair protein RAD14, putative [Plasmodium berghei]|uniref:DNA repair protein RAD14, putative n=2 Tax=Plasmodium berghei TaxID=5821 RepID=A0A509AM87_PLABA|nr:DNA repair protein RAD14, putative [Plasmodium berghei ANKA]CXI77583.1 DNA repair protein RAD14, putative [Plasmodium berghei]SCM25068.1 DNA repair protein RAD14, putative [Plasmodium berghei]SCN27252.1 DNA repair protein RAD14, putative [Plasmodium berghei]SCO61845.1 DNA repair protein RAD14, putative [Plasmodium berghei]SCO63678.1 DNA repair protein RAD14, putative [Plasmodium berghei]|eukprot:XP_034422888.1 DNA repair protein RAD14, putative [Plasmodium berghei ANKA]
MSDNSQSQNEEDEESYYHIFYENNLVNDINYFEDSLPHINFYLKFQNKRFLESFFDDIKNKNEISTPNIEVTDNEVQLCEFQKEENELKEIRKNKNSDILKDGGFYINNDSEIECYFENIKKNYNDTTNPITNISEEKHITNYSFLERNHEFTKQANIIFQKNKEKFIFSIERGNINCICNKGNECSDCRSICDDNSEIILKEICFLCNKKKKVNKTLCSIKIYVCYDCKSTDSNFRMISLTKLINKYSINNNDLIKHEKELALLSTKNPRGYSKNMKLYFLFQIKEIAIRKYGSLQKVKCLYNSKILNIKNVTTNNNNNKENCLKPGKEKKKKILHKYKKAKTIYSNDYIKNMEKNKMICEDNKHEFDNPICINNDDNIYIKKCIKCQYELEFIDF